SPRRPHHLERPRPRHRAVRDSEGRVADLTSAPRRFPPCDYSVLLISDGPRLQPASDPGGQEVAGSLKSEAEIDPIQRRVRLPESQNARAGHVKAAEHSETG